MKSVWSLVNLALSTQLDSHCWTFCLPLVASFCRLHLQISLAHAPNQTMTTYSSEPFLTNPTEKVDWNTFVVLQSSDEPPMAFKVHRDAAMQSDVLRDLLADHEEGTEAIVPVPNATAAILGYVVVYLEHHITERGKEISMPLTNDLSAEVDEWDYKFVRGELVPEPHVKENQKLLEVMMVANFLKINELLHLCAAACADMMKGKDTQGVRELFGIVSDFSPQREAAIREEYKWMKDC